MHKETLGCGAHGICQDSYLVLPGARPASSTRPTAASTSPAGEVCDMMSLCGGFYLIFFAQKISGKQKVNDVLLTLMAMTY